MKSRLFSALVSCLVSSASVLAGLACPQAAKALPPIPEPVVSPSAGGERLLRACLEAHGGAAAYARLRDVNVRLDGRWAFLAPKLQPKLADPHFRGGSEERYLPVRGGFVVGQIHTGRDGRKFVSRTPGKGPAQVWYDASPRRERDAPAGGWCSMALLGPPAPSRDPEHRAAAALVADAYTMFLFGPEFFVRRGAKMEPVPGTDEVDDRVCDRLLTVLRPGFGEAAEDRVLLFVDRSDHRLRRVQFTLNGLESTRGAEVHVDLLDHARLAGSGVLWPTRFLERIDRPVSVTAHRWALAGFDVNRGYNAADLAGPGFKGGATSPAGKR